MKLIILATLIALSFSIECGSDDFKGNQICADEVSDCDTLSAPYTCSACSAGYGWNVDWGRCYENDSRDQFTNFDTAQSGHSSQCASLSVGGATTVTTDNYTTTLGCIVDSQTVCNSCPAGKYIDAGVCKGSCISGCSVCKDKDTCETCETGKGYITGTTNACTACTDSTGCANCDGAVGTCKTCNAGYKIDTAAGTCTVCDGKASGCIKCATAVGTCDECSSDKFYTDGANCVSCSTTKTGVKRCKADPTTEGNILECSSGWFYISGTGCVQATDGTNCLEIDANGKCTECLSDAFVVHNDKCVSLDTLSAGCTKAADAATGVAAVCSECGALRQYTVGSIAGEDWSYTWPIYAYYKDTSNLCQKCGDYCKSCSAGKLCEGGCISNSYHIDNETTATKCTPCGTGILTCDSTKATIVTGVCREGRAPWDATNNAACATECLEGCKECSFTDAATKCTTCEEEYYKDGDKCVKCSTAVTNCDECSSKTECTKCEYGFALKSATSCAAITNCAEHDRTANACKYCKLGYYNKGTECTVCTTDCPTKTCGALQVGLDVTTGTSNASVLAYCSTILLALLMFFL